MNDSFLITKCPHGCRNALVKSNIVVFEGALRECAACGQLVSSCSKTYYEKSNRKWDTEEGTWPSEKDFARLLKRRSRDAGSLSGILSKSYQDIRMLDVGCSNGSSVFIFDRLGLKAEGIDPSQKAVRNGRKRGLNLHLGLLNKLSFQNDAFDAITLYEVIEHVVDPISLLNACHRILRPDGVVLIGTGNTDSWTRNIRKSKWDFFDMRKHGGHVSFFSLKSIKTLASRTGFEVVKIRTSSVTFCEKGEAPYIVYKILKIFSELLNLPAKIFNKGHQMEAYLRSNQRASTSCRKMT